MAEKQAEKQELKYLVRIANTDLDGKKGIMYALAKIKGVNKKLSNAVCRVAKVDHNTKIGTLPDSAIEKLTDIIVNPLQYKIPAWMLNRRNDPETGVDGHLLSTDLHLAVDGDIKQMKKIRSYRGVRHMFGLPSRGQRTKSNFRKNKGKVRLGVRVSKKAKSGKT